MNTKILGIAVFLMLFATLSMTVVFNNENICLEEHIVTSEKSSCALSESFDWWPMLGHDLEHTRYSTSSAPETNRLNWSYLTDGDVESSPAVVNGRLYIGSSDKNLYCLDAETGAELWKYTTDDSIKSSSAVLDGRIYIGSNDDNVYCLNAQTGEFIWNYTTGGDVQSSPAVYDERVYIGSSDKNLYCLDAETGNKLWNYTTKGGVRSSPAVSDGRVYVGEYALNGNVYCLNAEDGSKIWNYTTNHIVTGSPLIYNDKLFICSLYCTIYCLDALNGSERWSFQINGFRESSPAVYNNKIYVVLGQNTLYCLHALNGSEIWTYQIGSGDSSSPAVADGKVFIGADVTDPPLYQGCVYCLDAETSADIWTYQTNGNIHSSPAIAEGRVYIGSNDNRVYCFGDIPETNEPPRRPSQPIGQTEGKIDVEYNFATTTFDPQGDPIYYWFDWGDNTNSGWITSSSKSHSWSQEGTYQIKVKAKDIHGAESDWSNTLTVDIVEPTQEEPKEQQFIFGTVLDDSGTPIESARVCAITDDTTSKCKITGDQGAYYISVSTGTYTVVASKDGYYTSTQYDIVVEAKQAIQTDFVLSGMEQEVKVSGDANKQIMQVAIDAAREANKLGAEINIQQTTQEITTYRDIEVEFLEQTKDTLKFNITGEGSGAIIVISIDERQLSNINNIEVTYDGIPIEMGNIASIFNLEGDTPYYGILITRNEAGDPELNVNVILYSPHFSEHTITITSLAEAIVSITVVILYIVISAIVLFLFFSPMLANLLHIQRQSRKKK